MRRLAVAATAALMLTLSACGGGSGSTQNATKLIATSADKAVAAKTARVSGQIKVETRGKTQSIPIDGLIDFGNGAVEFNYDMSQMGLPGAAHGIRARMVDGVMYLDIGALVGDSDEALAITGGKSWAKIDLRSSVAGASGELGNASPSGALDALRGADNVEKVGTETVRGVETTHYRATVDPTKALDRAPAALRAQIEKGLAMFKGPVPIQVWIDADGRTRKLSMDVSLESTSASMTFEYYDFGVAVDVSAPPADDVFDFSQLLGGQGALTGTGSPAA